MIPPDTGDVPIRFVPRVPGFAPPAELVTGFGAGVATFGLEFVALLNPRPPPPPKLGLNPPVAPLFKPELSPVVNPGLLLFVLALGTAPAGLPLFALAPPPPGVPRPAVVTLPPNNAG